MRYLLRLRVESLWQRHADRDFLGGAGGRAALRDDSVDEDSTLRHRTPDSTGTEAMSASRTHRVAVIARLESLSEANLPDLATVRFGVFADGGARGGVAGDPETRQSRATRSTTHSAS